MKGSTSCTDFTAFMMLSRTAFRLRGASKTIRSFSVASQVLSMFLMIVNIHALMLNTRPYVSAGKICAHACNLRLS